MKRFVSIILLLGAAGWSQAFDWDPFHESIVATNGATFEAWRPFYSSSVDGERWRKDYLWPLYTRKGFKDEVYGRFLLLGWSNDFSPETDRHRNWLMPFYFQGTAADGEDYFAIFPLGGTIREFSGRDRIWFVLFPLFARSSINEVETTSILWPIGSKTTGDRVDRFRIWPLYGQSSLEGEYRKKFVLWPIYNSVEYTNERNPGGGFILMPLYGRIATENSTNQWIFPPFFRFAEGGGQRVVHAPWPFIQLADGDIHKRYIWPIYGKKEAGALSQQFWLWPIVWNSTTTYAAEELHRFRIVPVFHYETRTVTESSDGAEVGDVPSKYWKIWPLMSWAREDDSTRFRALELWPPYREVAGTERNWAPFWTVYQRDKDADGVDHELLWGVYRQSRGEDHVEWSLLKGLVGYGRNDAGRSFRLLFFRFGAAKETR